MSAIPQYKQGQVIEHKLFDYRGVIIGVDNEFSLPEEWYEAVAKSRPPKERPWYHVLVDNASHSTYVAERHLQLSDDSSQINHPLLGKYFNHYEKGRYYYERSYS